MQISLFRFRTIVIFVTNVEREFVIKLTLISNSLSAKYLNQFSFRRTKIVISVEARYRSICLANKDNKFQNPPKEKIRIITIIVKLGTLICVCLQIIVFIKTTTRIPISVCMPGNVNVIKSENEFKANLQFSKIEMYVGPFLIECKIKLHSIEVYQIELLIYHREKKCF